MHSAWRWFTGLGFDQEIPYHSTFLKSRHGRTSGTKLYVWDRTCPAHIFLVNLKSGGANHGPLSSHPTPPACLRQYCDDAGWKDVGYMLALL
jgi:hypothetical protein